VSRGLGSAQRRYHQHLADYLGAPNAVPSPVDNRRLSRKVREGACGDTSRTAKGAPDAYLTA